MDMGVLDADTAPRYVRRRTVFKKQRLAVGLIYKRNRLVQHITALVEHRDGQLREAGKMIFRYQQTVSYHNRADIWEQKEILRLDDNLVGRRCVETEAKGKWVFTMHFVTQQASSNGNRVEHR
jgi:hypothetical protein